MRLPWIVLVACGGAPVPELPSHHAATVAPIDHSGPCGILDAIYASKDRAWRQFFSGSNMHHPITFRVDARPEVFPPDTVCPGRPYQIFHGDPELRGMIVVVGIGAADRGVIVSGTLDDPNGQPTPDGGWDTTDCYCGILGDSVQRAGDHWRIVARPQ